MELNIYAISVVAILLATYYVIKKKLKYWQNKGVFVEKPSVPFGNAKNIILQKESIGEAIGNFHHLMKSRSIPYGGYYVLTKPIFVPVDIELIRRIMISDFDHFTDRLFHSNTSDPLSSHLFARKGESWKNLRQKLSPVFTPSKVKMMYPLITESVINLINLVNAKMEVSNIMDIDSILMKYAMDVTISSSFGVQPNTLKNNHTVFEQMGKLFFEESLWGALVRSMSVVYPGLLSFFKIRSVHRSIADFFIKLTNDIITYRENNNVVRQDLMHSLLQIRNNVAVEDDKVGFVKNFNDNRAQTLTDTDVAAQCFIFFLGGYETTSSLISFFLYELAVHQDIQRKAREEIQMARAKYGDQLLHEALNELGYLEKCIKETLRKHASLPLHSRLCTKDYKIPNSNVIIEKGTAVFISVRGLHYDSEFYQDPEIFNPERFTNASKQPCIWTPFGDGPRICIGYQMGMAVTKLAIVEFLLNFKFTIDCKTESPLSFKKTTFTHRAENGIWLNIKKL
ncbi:hypothetical protein FQA39_LY16768 [Lamprigera yunnana]|nr:hypothetical protein FQA39_LY16768 [Lamprigera yunnana]